MALWRKLYRSPGFSVVAVLTLALGIGAVTAIVSLVHGVLLQPLPYEDADELYGLWHSGPGVGIPEFEQSNTTYTVYRDLSQSFEGIGLYDAFFSMNLTGLGEPVQLTSVAATASLFRVLGVSAHIGRVFSEEDDEPGSPSIVLVSNQLWQGRLGADPGVVGRSLQLNGTAWEIVGVMPEGFLFPDESVQIWVPHVIEPEDLGQVNFSFDAVGRLKPGVTEEAAERELNELLKRVPELYPGDLTPGLMESARMSAHINPLMEDVVGEVSQALWIVLGTVSFVLLIACANVANLFLVRAEGRQREIALRSALGASRIRMLRYFLAESLTLALLAGLVGVGLALAALRALVALSPQNIPRLEEIGLHAPVLAFAAGVSLLSGLVFGIIPVLRMRRPNLIGGINEGSLRASSGRETHRVRGALVVAQVALALVLLIASGLMARSYWELRNVHPGFEPDGLLTLRLSLPRAEYPEAEDAGRFYQDLMEALSALPGVTGVGSVSNFPMTDSDTNNGVHLEDYPLQPDELPPIIRTNWAMPGYFETSGIPLLVGRTFERRDHEERTGVAVISRSMAEKHWPNRSALGRRLAPGLPEENPQWYTIVGVVSDVRDDGLEHEPVPMIYYPVVGLGGENDDWVLRTMTVALRSHAPVSTLGAAIRRTVWELDPNLPIISIRSGEEIVSRAIARTSYTMILLAIAAGVALLLGSIGIYGVISYTVSQRTREIGVRMALGARRSDVSRMILREGMRLTGLGVAAGLLGALFASDLLSSVLFGVSRTDPWTFAAVSIFLAAVALVASYLPARRASGVSPNVALRYE